MEAPFIMRLMASSVAVAARAGHIVRQVLSSGNLGIIDKGVNDLQTRADRTSQACIVKSLQKKFPGLCIIGEEVLSAKEMDSHSDVVEDSLAPDVLLHPCPAPLTNVPLDKVVVWVDPLDGTSEFTQGLVHHVTVLIGVAIDGRAVGGVICQPFYEQPAPATSPNPGRTVWGLEGLGAFGLSDRRLAAGEPPAANIITTTRSHSSGIVMEAVEACKPTEVLRMGGCGHKVLLLLEGRAHSYVFASPGCKKWDTCAPEAVLRVCGGFLTDIHGNRIAYHAEVEHPNDRGVLATAKAEWHPLYVRMIPRHVLDALS